MYLLLAVQLCAVSIDYRNKEKKKKSIYSYIEVIYIYMICIYIAGRERNVKSEARMDAIEM